MSAQELANLKEAIRHDNAYWPDIEKLFQYLNDLEAKIEMASTHLHTDLEFVEKILKWKRDESTL